MPTFVLDASAILSSIIAEERTDAADRLLLRLTRETAIVPAVWGLEIANALLRAEQHKRIPKGERANILNDLRTLSIEYDDQTVERAWTDILAVAEEHAVSSYDAAYLELALRRKVPLITRDRRMAQVATAVGLETAEV